MNEPEHPHFVLSDGQYCHVMPEGLIIAKKKIPDPRPVQNDKPDYLSATFLIVGALILAGFIVACAMIDFFVVIFMLSLLELLILGSLFRMLGYSQTNFIPRADITGVDYKKRNFGYDYFVVHYAGKNGKDRKRRLVIYDSQDCLNQALKVMKSEGLLGQ
jgi:hypothetical protein